jgi:sec-independent protein translocase protein TatA
MTLYINLFIGGSDFLLILIVLVFLFGGTKIPQLMKGLGEGIKEFKKASKEDVNETHPDKPISENK